MNLNIPIFYRDFILGFRFMMISQLFMLFFDKCIQFKNNEI